jgi:peptidyl-prolyl cis-trans isomerase SurA
MNRSLAIGLVALMASGAVAYAQQATRPASGPAAAPRGQAVEGVAVLVNDEVISYSDVRNRTRMILLSLGSQQQPDEDTILEAQARAIEGLIEEKVKYQTFRELSKDRAIPDAEVDERLNRVASSNNQTLDQFAESLARSGIPIQTMRDQARADIAWTAIVRGRFARDIRVSELRISEMMDRTRASLNKPQYRVAEIFLYAPDVASKENALTRAQTLKRQIEQGAPFDLVAQQFSAAPSSSAGGDLGWITSADMRPEIQAAVEAAPGPSVLEPIQTEGGVYLIAALGKRDPNDTRAVSLDMKQVTATGPDAVQKLTALKAGATTCDQAGPAAQTAGLTATDLKGMALSDMSDSFRAALATVQEGQSSDVVDVGEDKAVFFVCARASGGAAMPTREDIRSRLFDQEISMLADRYLRDLKREATIIRR